MNGIVYKITCPDGRFYYGSTTNEPRVRLAQHKNWSQTHPTIKVYEAILSIGWDSVTIEMVEELKDANSTTLRQAEQRWIDLTDPLCLNSSRAFRTEEERREDKNRSARAKRAQEKALKPSPPKPTEEERKQRSREAAKRWRERNPDKVKEKNKQSRDTRPPLTPEELEAKRAYYREYMRRRRHISIGELKCGD
jgi:hypothetical protein